jgi:hypothetical protein
MELHEVVMKLVGPVRPIGSHGEDGERLESSADRHEASVKAIGIHAREFMDNVRNT